MAYFHDQYRLQNSATFSPNNSKEDSNRPVDTNSPPDEENAQRMQDSIPPGHTQGFMNHIHTVYV